MARRVQSIPANDNAGEPVIHLDLLDFPPLCAAELEIFDTLISNIEELAANDNKPPPKEPES